MRFQSRSSGEVAYWRNSLHMDQTPEASQRLCPYLCPSQSVVVVVIQAVLAIVVVTDGYAKSPTLVGNTRFDGNVGKSAIVIIMQKHDPGGILSLGVP